MYRLFGPVFQGHLPFDALLKRVRYERFLSRTCLAISLAHCPRLYRDALLFQAFFS